MAECNLEKRNIVEIVGTLTKVDVNERTNKTTAQDFVSGVITVQSIINGVKNEFNIHLYAQKLTKTNAISKLYESYMGLKDAIGNKIRVSGSLGENRFVVPTTKCLTSEQRINGRFINMEKSDTPDKATFEFSGYVFKGLTELRNKNQEVYGYEIIIGQANWNEEKLGLFKFNVRPEEVQIVKSIQTLYPTNATVRFNGELSAVTTEKVITQEVAFGEPKTKVFQNTTRNFFITGGEQPILVAGQMYDANTIIKLNNQYNTHDAELMTDFNNKNVSMTTDLGSMAAVSMRQTSLI